MDAEIDIVRVVLSFLLVAGLIGGSALVLKWLTDKSLLVRHMQKDKRLRLLESLPLDTKHKAFLLGCDGMEYMVISHAGQLQVLPHSATVPAANHVSDGGDDDQASA